MTEFNRKKRNFKKENSLTLRPGLDFTYRVENTTLIIDKLIRHYVDAVEKLVMRLPKKAEREKFAREKSEYHGD